MNYPPYGGGGGGYSVGGFSPSGPPGYGGGGGYPSPPHPYGPAVQVRTHEKKFSNENYWGKLTVLAGFPFPTPTVRRQLPLLRPHSWRVPLSAVRRRRVPLPVLQHGPGGVPRPGNGLPPAVPSAAAASPVRPRRPRRSERVPQAWDGRWRRIVSGTTKQRILTKRTASIGSFYNAARRSASRPAASATWTACPSQTLTAWSTSGWGTEGGPGWGRQRLSRTT